jgi:hypothetical protein
MSLKLVFHKLNVERRRGVLTLYQSRKDEGGGAPFQRPVATLL